MLALLIILCVMFVEMIYKTGWLDDTDKLDGTFWINIVVVCALLALHIYEY